MRPTVNKWLAYSSNSCSITNYLPPSHWSLNTTGHHHDGTRNNHCEVQIKNGISCPYLTFLFFVALHFATIFAINLPLNKRLNSACPSFNWNTDAGLALSSDSEEACHFHRHCCSHINWVVLLPEKHISIMLLRNWTYILTHIIPRTRNRKISSAVALIWNFPKIKKSHNLLITVLFHSQGRSIILIWILDKLIYTCLVLNFYIVCCPPTDNATTYILASAKTRYNGYGN